MCFLNLVMLCMTVPVLLLESGSVRVVIGTVRKLLILWWLVQSFSCSVGVALLFLCCSVRFSLCRWVVLWALKVSVVGAADYGLCVNLVGARFNGLLVCGMLSVVRSVLSC